MERFLRGALAVFLGGVAAVVTMQLIETLGHMIYPPPAGLDFNKPETVAAAMRAMPTGAFAAVLIGWAAAAFIGPRIASRMAPGWHFGHGMIVGGVLLAATVGNLVAIPHPTWVRVAAFVAIPAMAYLGARGRRPVGAEAVPVA